MSTSSLLNYLYDNKGSNLKSLVFDVCSNQSVSGNKFFTSGIQLPAWGAAPMNVVNLITSGAIPNTNVMTLNDPQTCPGMKTFSNGMIVGNVLSVTGDCNITGNAYAQGFYANSDQRIKTNIKSILPHDALVSLKNLEPKMFSFHDDASKPHMGFIAQELQQQLPQSVIATTAPIPNIMCSVQVLQDGNTIVFPHIPTIETFNCPLVIYLPVSNSSNEKTTISIERTIVTQIDDYTFVIDGEPLNVSTAFVYGQIVDDFLRINTDEIVALNVAATQALDHEVQYWKQKTMELEKQVMELKHLLLEIRNV